MPKKLYASCQSFLAATIPRHWMILSLHTSAVTLTGAKTRRAVQTMRLLTSAPFSITPANKAGYPKKTHAETSKNTARNAVKSILRITYIRPSIKPPANRCAT
nr:MAG TPA: hypothetical protein [Caudoviricetes sp.]